MSLIERSLTAPVFIGGHHRSGTTLLSVILNRHPHIACGPEGQLLDRTAFLEFHRFLEETWIPAFLGYELGDADIDRAVAAFVDEFFARYADRHGKRRWAEKTPKNIFHIDYLFRIFPEGRFVHMIRDPRDIHCSIMAKARSTTPRWLDATATGTARDWVRRIAIGTRWRTDPRYLEVRYEDLVCNPRDVMEQVVAFLGEPWDERVLDNGSQSESADLANVDRPIFASSVGRWRTDLAQDDVYAIEEIAGAVMSTLGYQLQREEMQESRSEG